MDQPNTDNFIMHEAVFYIYIYIYIYMCVCVCARASKYYPLFVIFFIWLVRDKIHIRGELTVMLYPKTN